MASEKSCPNKQDLERLMLGQLTESDTGRWAEHIEKCEQCIEAIRTLTPHDTLVSAMKQSPAAATDLPTGEKVQTLIDHVRGLVGRPRTSDTKLASSSETPTPPPSSPTAQTTIGETDSSAESHPDVYDFLAPPQSADEIGRLGPYRVLKVLGVGGMGIVFLAEDVHLERKVALKAMKPALAVSESAKKRFLREAKLAAAIEHDHIVGIHQVGEDRGVPFLAMPLLRGESLEDRLLRVGKLSINESLRIVREVAAGLAAAHDRDLMHRDIKPGNVWLEDRSPNSPRDECRTSPTNPSDHTRSHAATNQSDSGVPHAEREAGKSRVKILDFGLARAADDSSNLTQLGAIAGTPAYMSPEQAQGQPVDQRCDLFSLGAVLYRCVTGVQPFQGQNTIAVLMAVTHQPPQPVRGFVADIPEEVEKLIGRLLEKNPADRLPSAHEVVAAIVVIEQALAAAKQEPLTHAPTPAGAVDLERRFVVAPRPGVMARRSRWVSLMLTSGALFGLVLAVVVYRIQTDKGTLVVEIHDDAVEAKLKSKGIEVQDSKSGRSFTIQAIGSRREATGNYKLADGQGLRLIVLDDDGLEVTTNEFKLTRGGKVRVSVRAETDGMAANTSPQVFAAEPDRRAAEYVLSIGGAIKINENEEQRKIAAVSDLPRRAFELTVVDVRGPKVTDAGLVNFKDCKNLTDLNLDGTTVSDTGLAHFAGCPTLVSVNVKNTKVTEAGVKKLSAALPVCKIEWDGGLIEPTVATDSNRPVAKKAPEPPPGWLVYHTEKGGYSVWFPGTPTESQTGVATKRGEREMSQVKLNDTTSGLTFFVSNADFSDRIFPDADKALDAARDGAMQKSKAELLSETRIMLGIHPGRELRFAIPTAKGVVLRMRIYLVGQRNYQLLIGGPEKAVEGPSAEAFLQSFRLDREF